MFTQTVTAKKIYDAITARSQSAFMLQHHPGDRPSLIWAGGTTHVVSYLILLSVGSQEFRFTNRAESSGQKPFTLLLRRAKHGKALFTLYGESGGPILETGDDGCEVSGLISILFGQENGDIARAIVHAVFSPSEDPSSQMVVDTNDAFVRVLFDDASLVDKRWGNPND